MAWLLLAPAIILTLLFLVIPVVYAAILSVQGTTISGAGLGVRQEVFVGFANFIAALTSADLLAGVGRILILGALTIPFTLGLALIFALLLDHPRVRFRGASRILIFLPFAVPGIIATLNWGFIYLPNVSPFEPLFALFGAPVPPILTETGVFFAIANIAIWGGVGFNMIVLYTALRAVPGEIYDAARIDGCSEAQIAWRIKIPLIIPGIVLTSLFSLIGTLQIFSEPTALAKLTNSISDSWVPMMTVYRDAFVLNDPNRAAAMSIVIAVVTLALSLIVLRLAQRHAFRENS